MKEMKPKTKLAQDMELLKKGKIKHPSIFFHQLLGSFTLKFAYEEAQYLADAAFILTLWNDYLPVETSRVLLSDVVRLAILLCSAEKKGELKLIMELASRVRFIPASRYDLVDHKINDGQQLRQFVYRCTVDKEGYEKACKMDTVEIIHADLEKELIRRYSKVEFYERFMPALPIGFWYQKEDHQISRYHWILTRVWPDVREAMTCSGIPFEEHLDLAGDQRYADAFSDVMRQTVMRSLSGEIKMMSSPVAQVSQKSRQFVLKFMMDAKAMSNAYLNVAKIDTKKLPTGDQKEMFDAALKGVDPTDPNADDKK